MKKLVVVAFALLIGLSSSLKADEGMWIPMLINKNIAEMQKMGLKLTAEDIYDINNSSLKDAIVIFGRGCTGEIISSEGLLLTNHHCGYGSIQMVSTPEYNYLNDGFWAMSKDEEIPIDGLTVKFLVRMQDVTKETLSGIDDGLTDAEKNVTMKDNIKGVVDQATDGNGYDAVVKPIFGGNEYYLYVYETYTDIRLVGTPPESIGKFGSDTDNWMWPRHTGDFSMFRVYTNKDGKPATYAEDNIPLKPKHYLPVSTAGVEEGDFAMILGYPGGTERYLSSYGVDLAINESNMTIVDIRAEKLRIMREGMEADDAVRLQYSSKYARTANYWKYFIGQTKGLKRLKVKEKKQGEETAFTEWTESNPLANSKYGEALPMIEEAYDMIKQYNKARWYYREAVSRGSEIIGYSGSFNHLSELLNNKEAAQSDIDNEISKLKEGISKHFKDYNAAIDQNLLASMMDMFINNVPIDQQPVYLLEMEDKYKGNFNDYAAFVFEKSIFGDEQKLNDFLNQPKGKTLIKDPAMQANLAFKKKSKELAKPLNDANKILKEGSKLYIAGLREMNKDVNYYPDANFTMRLTYGIVEGYYPSDAVYYNYYTTMDGIIQKEDPNNWEFMVPEKLKELYMESDFGPYDEDGVMKVCFLTNHDITGGNSGSPVINGNGELIGLAFDGNWEAMSGDIAFENELQRTINVDIRYVLFIVDQFAGAKNLIEEMTIVTKKPCLKKNEEPAKAMEMESAATE